jgi:Zn-dependent peptidase ImmA (M78 family)
MTSDIKKEAARDAARLLSEVWNRPIPVDPAFVARAIGLRVREVELDDDTLGALVKRPNQEALIMLNESDPPNRKRFTCAHEIGHYRRRSGEEHEYTTVDLRSKLSTAGTDPEEIYANEFAACLLMPEEEVKRMNKAGLDPFDMAIAFGVSRDAMQFRLKNLGLSE